MMNRTAAETLAAEALAWMAREPDLIMAFLSTTGAGLGDLRARAGDPEFLGFVLDYLLSNEEALVAFCEDGGIHPETPLRARAALPGGEVPHWS